MIIQVLIKPICLVVGMTILSIDCLADEKPKQLIMGITTFLSGPASVFGKPSKVAAEVEIEKINQQGGILGVPIEPIFIDEGIGGDRLISEFRRVVQEEKADVMMAAVSSGNCKSLAPVAEDLKVLNVMWDCGTQQIFENDSYDYVVRTQGNAVQEMVSAAAYLLKVYPDFKTIAVVNQDYSWGRDSWDLFRKTLQAIKPDVKVVAEFFPKFGSSDFSSEISRLQVLRPDVVLSTSWGSDLDTFVRQSAQRGLMRRSKFILPLAESSLERLGNTLPEGVLVGGRGDHYFLHPMFGNTPENKAFVKAFKQRSGTYPIYSSYHMVQALAGLKKAYENASSKLQGGWPNSSQVAQAFKGLTFRGLADDIYIQQNGQGIEDQLFGITTKSSRYPFRELKDIVIVPGELVARPINGEKGEKWVESLTMDLVNELSFIGESQ